MSFPFYHWFTTLLLGPFLIALYEGIVSLSPDIVELYVIILLFSISLSLPVLLCYCFVFFLLNSYKVHVPIAKTILLAFVVIGIIITFQIIRGSFAFEFGVAYAIASIITGLILKLKKNSPLLNNATER